ncbi:hypothetical protein VN23_12665 [Janthinobacterium sp. B9-8]|nr:hypothetical protein VN23_12665 [Janthinobacterium sp. B9-8]
MHLYETNFEKAAKVVSENSYASIELIEKNIKPLEASSLLLDTLALSKVDFDAVQSPILLRALKKYSMYKNETLCRTNYSHEEVENNNFLDFTIDNWIESCNSPKEPVVNNNTLRNNSNLPTHIAIQNWILDDDVIGENLLGQLKKIANNVRPYLLEILGKNLPSGVRIELDELASESVLVHIVLELVLGCVDPLLIRSPVGDRMKNRLQEIRDVLELPAEKINARDVSDESLRIIFGNILE